MNEGAVSGDCMFFGRHFVLTKHVVQAELSDSLLEFLKKSCDASEQQEEPTQKDELGEFGVPGLKRTPKGLRLRMKHPSAGTAIDRTLWCKGAVDDVVGFAKSFTESLDADVPIAACDSPPQSEEPSEDDGAHGGA